MIYYNQYYVNGLDDDKALNAFWKGLLFRCDAFSLIYYKERENANYSQQVKNIKRKLSPYCISSSKVNEWPGTINMDRRQVYKMVLYRIDGNNISTILSVLSEGGGLWNWDYPDFPMDPCFYQKGRIVFASSTHELLNWLYLESKDIEYMYSEIISSNIDIILEKKNKETKDLFWLDYRTCRRYKKE